MIADPILSWYDHGINCSYIFIPYKMSADDDTRYTATFIQY